MFTKAGEIMSKSPEEIPSEFSDLIRGWAGVCAEVQKSRVQLWRDISNGKFPPPIEIGPNSIAWVRSEVQEWKTSRPRRTYGFKPEEE
jgi:predicted DNA-binding transcriptional regulator AlpA